MEVSIDVVISYRDINVKGIQFSVGELYYFLELFVSYVPKLQSLSEQLRVSSKLRA